MNRDEGRLLLDAYVCLIKEKSTLITLIYAPFPLTTSDEDTRHEFQNVGSLNCNFKSYIQISSDWRSIKLCLIVNLVAM